MLALNLIFSASILSQEMYLNDINGGSEDSFNELIQFNQNTLAIYSLDSQDHQSVGCVMFDEKLNPIFKREIDSFSISNGYNNTIVENDRFIIVGKNPYSSSMDILSFSSNGKLESRHSIMHTEYSFSIRGFAKFQDKYVISAYGVKEDVQDAILFWLNQDFSLDTTIIINKADWQDSPYQLFATEDELILSFSYWEPVENISWPNIYRGFLLFNIDKDIINEWYLGPDINFNGFPIESELIHDSIFVISTYSDFSTDRPEVLAINIHTNEIVWKSNFNYTSAIDRDILNFIESRDGNILGCGYRSQLSQIERTGWVFKIDASSGNILWEFMVADTIGLDQFSTSKIMLFSDITQLQNGDVIAGGFVANSFLDNETLILNEDLFCYKLGDDWCTELSCDSVNIENLQVQNEKNHLDVNSEWFYESLNLTSTVSGELIRIFVTKDTVIEFDSCFVIQLEKSGELINNSEITLCVHGQQMFFYENECMYRMLNYSDNIEIGDTFDYYLPQNVTEYDKVINSGLGEEIVNPYSLIINDIGVTNSEEGIPLNTYQTNTLIEINNCNDLGTYIEGISTMPSFFRRSCSDDNSVLAPIFRCYLSSKVNLKLENGECDILESTQENDFLTSIVISPNPVTNILTIDGLKKDNNIIVYNIYGQIIFQEKVIGDNIQISTYHWASGVYFISGFDGSNKYTNKILKE